VQAFWLIDTTGQRAGNRATGQDRQRAGNKIDTGQVSGQGFNRNNRHRATGQNIGQPGNKTRLPFFVSRLCNRAGFKIDTGQVENATDTGQVSGQDASLGKNSTGQPQKPTS